MTFSKLVRKVNCSERNFEEQKALALKSKKVHGIFGETFIFIIVFSCPSSKKPCLRFLFVCSAREIKGFYQSSVGNEVDFRDIMNVSANILAKN